MKKRFLLGFVLLIVAFAFGSVTMVNSQASQYPVADQVAAKLVGHWQQTSCADLWKERMQPASAEKEQMIQKAVQLMQNDPAMRKYFIGVVATPIVNKMFECGMIP